MSTETEPTAPVPPGSEAPAFKEAAQAGSAPRNEAEQAAPADPAARIAALEAEVANLRDRWVRAEAETENVRARGRREVDETRQYAVQKFARDIVEAAENLRRGISSLPPQSPDEPAIVTRVREGLEGMERSFVGILERHGVRAEDPTGKPFDANVHQAMAEQPSETHAPGSVMQAWTSAWTLNGRLLKPAMVVVAKSAAPAEPRPTSVDTTA
ncbi:MAG TPA: nucleotide exchange factor GrpE [Acetobacteraceae bacterium]|nr:nucleotide exchange factor GrpE [Acetobacteraceae bacterium]